jgi:HAD superfamily hydrolase (TIGR01490 family)
MGNTISGVNPALKSYTVFMDLDHTIISKISGKALAVNAVRKGYVKPSELLMFLISYLLYKLRLIDPLSMSAKMIRWTRGISESTMMELCNDTTENLLFPSVYSEAIIEIESHKRKNARIVLLSASIAQVCSNIAARIGIDDVISTSLEIKDGFLTGQSNGRLCFGDEKTTRLREYCLQKSINISESLYYGDSLSDLPVFVAVGSPVCVNPDRKLKRTAHEKGWKILTWSA